MKRELLLTLCVGCLVILVLEAPAALSSVSEGLRGPYEVHAASPEREASFGPEAPSELETVADQR